MAREKDHLKHEAEVKSLMMEVVRMRANTEEEAASASTKTKELGRVMKQVDSAMKQADRSVRVADLEIALAEKTRLHQEELQ